MNDNLRQLIEQSDALALQTKVAGLKRMALDEFRKLDQSGQMACLNAIEVGEVPGTPDFVWTCIVHAGLGELALMDFLEGIANDRNEAMNAGTQCETTEDTERTEATPAIPDGFVLMPCELTAENGAKAALIGEFHELIEVPNPDYDPEDHDDDEEPEFFTQAVPVSWNTIKQIYAAAVVHFQTTRNEAMKGETQVETTEDTERTEKAHA